jgi:hypothetical protein
MIYLGLVLRLWQSSVTQDGVYLISSYEGWAITGKGAAYSSRLLFADIFQRRLLVRHAASLTRANNTHFLWRGSPSGRLKVLDDGIPMTLYNGQLGPSRDGGKFIIGYARKSTQLPRQRYTATAPHLH